MASILKVYAYFLNTALLMEVLGNSLKSPGEFLSVAYINFDHCTRLGTSSVVVSMIIAAKR
jgi:hypothetical protein